MSSKKNEESQQSAALATSATQSTAGWLTRKQSAVQLGVHISTIRRYEASGDLHPVVTPNGVHMFDPDEVEALAGSNERDAGAVVLGVLREDNQQQREHNEKLMQLIGGTVFKVLELAQKIASDATARAETLETRLDAARAAAEAAESKEFDRSLAVTQLQASEVRKKELLGIVKQNMPAILALIATKDGNTAHVQESAILQFVQSLTEEQIAKVFASGVFSVGQMVFLKSMVEASHRPVKSDATAPAAPAPTDPKVA